MARFSFRFVLFAAHLVSGCAAAPDDLAVKRAPITEGSPSTGDLNVVAVINSDRVVCSGTLVHPRVVLTAAHCVTTGLSVFFGAQLARGAGTIPVVEARAHPSFDRRTLANDIGVLLLEATAPTDVPIAKLYPGPFDDSHLASEVRIAGFGANAGGAAPASAKHAGRAVITAYEDTRFRVGPAPSLTCAGDSGGPAFLSVDGVEYLAGVTSGGDTQCATFSIETRVDAFAESFIHPYLDAVRDGSLPAGRRCLYDAQCQGSVCLAPADAPEFRYCADPCSSAADCPVAMSCALAARHGQLLCQFPLPSPGALGASCRESTECGTTLCARPSANEASICSARCLAGRLPCSSGFECRELETGEGACFQSDPGDVSGGACALDRRGAVGRAWLIAALVAAMITFRRRAGRRPCRSRGPSCVPSAPIGYRG